MHFKMEKIQNNCPICIKDFKSMNSNSNISKQIVNIQRIINPYIFSYQYYSDSIKMKPETNCSKKFLKVQVVLTVTVEEEVIIISEEVIMEVVIGEDMEEVDEGGKILLY